MIRSSQCPSPLASASRIRSISPPDSAASDSTVRPTRSAKYGRSQGWASNSKAWVASWRAMKVRNSSRGMRIVAAVPTMFGSTKCSRPRAGPAASSETSYWPSTLRPRKASMKPSCWLPTVRFSQRDIARPAVSGPSCCSSIVRSMRSKRTRNVARFRSTHSRRSTTAGISSASGSCEPISSATIGSIFSSVDR